MTSLTDYLNQHPWTASELMRTRNGCWPRSGPFACVTCARRPNRLELVALLLQRTGWAAS